jgi:hypothetical protein
MYMGTSDVFRPAMTLKLPCSSVPMQFSSKMTVKITIVVCLQFFMYCDEEGIKTGGINGVESIFSTLKFQNPLEINEENYRTW